MLLPLMALGAVAQNSAHYKAQALMRDKKDFQKAAQICEAALQNPKTTKKAPIARDLGMAYASLFNQQLAKAASGLPFDTAAFCNYLDKSIAAFTESDKFDHEPDKKGRVKPKLEQLNHLNLSQMVDYYNYAAIFKVQSGHNKESLVYFEKFLKFPENRIFSKAEADSLYKAKKDAYTQASTNMMRISYSLKNWDDVIRYAQLYTPTDSVGLHDYYVMQIDANLMKKDTVGYSKALINAVSVTGSDNLIAQLINFYMRRQNRAEAVRVCDNLIKKNPESKKPYYIKGVIEMNMPPYNYDAARSAFAKAIEIDPQFIDAIKNLGVCWVNDIVEQRQAGKVRLPSGTDNASKKRYNKIKEEKIDPYYKNALPYFERLKELRPNNPDIWAEGLYNVYYNLQMFEKAKELKPLLKSANN